MCRILDCGLDRARRSIAEVPPPSGRPSSGSVREGDRMRVRRLGAEPGHRRSWQHRDRHRGGGLSRGPVRGGQIDGVGPRCLIGVRWVLLVLLRRIGSVAEVPRPTSRSDCRIGERDRERRDAGRWRRREVRERRPWCEQRGQRRAAQPPSSGCAGVAQDQRTWISRSAPSLMRTRGQGPRSHCEGRARLRRRVRQGELGRAGATHSLIEQSRAARLRLPPIRFRYRAIAGVGQQAALSVERDDDLAVGAALVGGCWRCVTGWPRTVSRRW